MSMRFDSTSARHKLLIAALLLTLFAIPFAVSRQNLGIEDSKAILAGGAVIGSSASEQNTLAQPTNDASQVSEVVGHSFVGGLAPTSVTPDR